jgi:hypothetical protein
MSLPKVGILLCTHFCHSMYSKKTKKEKEDRKGGKL